MMIVNRESSPLGILPTVALLPHQQRCLTVLEEFDLSPVRKRLLQDGTMPEAWLDEALLEFRRYLGLRALTPGPLIMFSDHIDHIWHTCIIFTRLYAELCERAFGEFVHHEPSVGHIPDRHEQIAALQELYRQTYGPMGPLWGAGHRRGCA